MSYLTGAADYSDLPSTQELGADYSGNETNFLTGSLTGIAEGAQAAGHGFSAMSALSIRTMAEGAINSDPRVVQGDQKLRDEALTGVDEILFHEVKDSLTSIDALDRRDRGFMGQMTYGLSRAMTEYATGGLTGLMLNEAVPRTAQELNQGVDMGTAAALGTLQGGVQVAGFALPASIPLFKAGSPLAQRLAYGVASNVPLGMAQRGGEKALLESANDIRSQDVPEWNDIKSVALDTFVGAAIGGATRLHEVSKAKALIKKDVKVKVPESPIQPELKDHLSESSKAVILAENLNDYTERNSPLVGNTPEAEQAIRLAMTETETALREGRPPDLSMLDGHDINYVARDLPNIFDATDKEAAKISYEHNLAARSIIKIRESIGDGVGLRAFRDSLLPADIERLTYHSVTTAPNIGYLSDRAMGNVKRVEGGLDPVVRDPLSGKVYVMTDHVNAGSEKATAERAIMMAKEELPVRNNPEPLNDVAKELVFAQQSEKELRKTADKDVHAILDEAVAHENKAKDAISQVTELIGCMLNHV